MNLAESRFFCTDIDTSLSSQAVPPQKCNASEGVVMRKLTKEREEQEVNKEVHFDLNCASGECV